jgi:hypothetical protein
MGVEGPVARPAYGRRDLSRSITSCPGAVYPLTEFVENAASSRCRRVLRADEVFDEVQTDRAFELSSW